MSRKMFVAAVTALCLLIGGLTGVAAGELAGTWTKKSFAVKGGFKFIEEGGKTFLVLDEKFSTRNAPDLKLFLTNRPLADATGRNAAKDAVLIAKLQKNKGAQRYPLPDGVSLSDYTTLLLHCEQYSKLWAGSSLR
ncbi:hypothetical protein ABI59_22555 [Acidobacteria bacterium Mor1]|nr:hypothetical protein ABI59_22555 [Acidobacteria bacterium Mor1]